MTDPRIDVMRSCRILDHFGQDHFCFGHVSYRPNPGGPILIKAAGVGLGRVEVTDIATVDDSGMNLTAGLRLHDETALHVEIYRSRADVGAVVHTHPLSVQAMTMLEFTGDVYSQDGVAFQEKLTWYDHAALISNAELGETFAACLGQGRAALLRSHGLVTVGADVAEATVMALLLERSVAAWMLASSAGLPRPIGDDLRALVGPFERAHRSRIESIWRDSLRAASLH